jgi:hypothetical protein
VSHVVRRCEPYDVAQLEAMPDWMVARVAAENRNPGNRPGYSTRRIILWFVAYRANGNDARYRKFMRRYQMAWKAEKSRRSQLREQFYDICCASSVEPREPVFV